MKLSEIRLFTEHVARPESKPSRFMPQPFILSMLLILQTFVFNYVWLFVIEILIHI